MRKTLVVLALLVLAGCGSSKAASPSTSTPPPVPTAVQPSAEQVAMAKELAAKIGCPDAAVTQGGPPMSADAECSFGPDPAHPLLAGEPTDFTASINAYANQADRDAALAKLNSLGHFRGVQGPTWIVTCDEDLNAEKRVIQLTGGQQLGAID